MTLTTREIRDLAAFAGLVLSEEKSVSHDEDDTEIAIVKCPEDGLIEDDGSRLHYRYIAYYDDLPEEGSFGLGERLSEPNDRGMPPTL